MDNSCRDSNCFKHDAITFKMKLLLLTTIATLLFIGCSDPEAEANKLFTEASQLVKDADAITEPYSLEAYSKRKAAIELLEKFQSIILKVRYR